MIINRVPPQFGLTDFDWVGSTLEKRNLLNKLVFVSRLSWRRKTNSFSSSILSHQVLMSQKLWPSALLANLACISEGEQDFQGTFYKVSIQMSPYYKIYPFCFPVENTTGIKKQSRWGEALLWLRHGSASVRTCQRPLLPLLQFCRSLPPSVHFLQLILWFSQKLALTC